MKMRCLLAWLLVWLLVLLLAAIPLASHAQAVPSRDELIRTIQKDAQVDAHVQGRDWEDRRAKEFSGKRPDLGEVEVRRIYDEAYLAEQTKMAQKPADPEKAPGTFAERFGKLAYPVLVILLALIAVFRNHLETLFRRISEWAGRGVYNLFAGGRAFRGIALRHYRRALLDKFEELTIPFRTKSLLMRNVFVPLKVAGNRDAPQIDAFHAISENRRLMIVGSPGSGKSMLLKYLALAYAEGRLLALPDRPVPVLLPLNRLNKGRPLVELLAEELKDNDFPRAEGFIDHTLHQGTLMLLLDGFDEVDTTQRTEVVEQVRRIADKHKECRILVTCRSEVYHNEFAWLTPQKLEIQDFTDQQIRGFLRSWEGDMRAASRPDKTRSPEQLMQTLADRPAIMKMARNPLLLTIIAYLYTDTEFELPRSRAQFYENATLHLLDLRDPDKNIVNQFSGRNKRIVLQRLGLYFQINTVDQQDSRSMDVQSVLAQVKLALPGLGLPEDGASAMLDEIVKRSGLMISLDNETRYAFAHLTLQEFFAAVELKGDADALMAHFLEKPDRWVEVVKLWCGTTDKCTELIDRLYLTHPLIAFDCLADAGEVAEATVTKIVEAFKAKLGGPQNQETIARAFAAVAADSRPRGAAVFQFLKGTLESDPKPERQSAAAMALSLTNLPVAAATLASQAEAKPEVRQALLRMGDLAVPPLMSLMRKAASSLTGPRPWTNDWVPEVLQATGTPTAARALCDLLWVDDPLAMNAAWRLAALFNDPSVEEGLREYSLDEFHRRAARFDWVWEPFDEPVYSSLPVIAGRLVWLMDQHVATGIQNAPSGKPIDPRLGIPSSLSQVGPIQRTLNSEGFGLSIFAAEPSTTPEPPGGPGEVEKWRPIAESFPHPARVYLGSLPPALGMEFIHRLVSGRLPTIDDWRNIFHPVKYEFDKGVHARACVALFSLLSLVALWRIGTMIYRSPAYVSATNAALTVMALGLAFVLYYYWFTSDGRDSHDTLFPEVVPGPALNLVPGVSLWRSKNGTDVFAGLLVAIPFPAAVGIVAYSLHDYTSWPVVVATLGSVLLIGAAFWIRGKTLERKANNPLTGLLTPPVRDPWRDFRYAVVRTRKPAKKAANIR